MRAFQLEKIGTPLVEREVPAPEAAPGTVVVDVAAVGICHSDAHYRSGESPTGPLPLTLGHEVSGVITAVGAGVSTDRVGERVSLHYLVSCGRCYYCRRGLEQFCPRGEMIGKHRDGGFAEQIAVPAANALRLPDAIPAEHGAVLMCSAATALHALRKSRFAAGERVAVFGAGGLGMTAVQLARALGALDVFAVDRNRAKLDTAAGYGAIPVNAAETDPVEVIRSHTEGRGVDVALELVGIPETVRAAVLALAPTGRAAAAGIGDREVSFHTYREFGGSEAELIGVSDHTRVELELLLELAERGRIDFSGIVTERIPFSVDALNERLDALDAYASAVRTVIVKDTGFE
ncbi:MAG: alcohol dehydrogenase catalytic domain-containing protein [Spirochaetaceae bacterium]